MSELIVIIWSLMSFFPCLDLVSFGGWKLLYWLAKQCIWAIYRNMFHLNSARVALRKICSKISVQLTSVFFFFFFFFINIGQAIELLFTIVRWQKNWTISWFVRVITGALTSFFSSRHLDVNVEPIELSKWTVQFKLLVISNL